MPVKRISDLNISQRGLFTAIYGNVNEDEFFVDDDLKKYNLWSQLYIYLKKEGYSEVLFYDTTNNFHSYTQVDLASFLNLGAGPKPNEGIVRKDRYVATHIKRPLGRNNANREPSSKQRSTADENPVHQSIQLVTEQGPNNHFYRTSINRFLLEYFKEFLSNARKKAAIIIKYPDISSFEATEKYLNAFRDLNANYKKDDSENKILIVYSCSNSSSLIENLNRNSTYLFVNNYFKSQFLVTEPNGERVKAETAFQVSLPEQSEIRNWMNRKRIYNGFKIFGNVPYEKIALRFVQERKRLTDFENYRLNDFIMSINSKSGWDRLNELTGLATVKSKVKDVVSEIKYIRQHNLDLTYRPHLCFLGNPGTGKTTVASIVAEIFKEEGIVPVGHYTSTKASDLMGQHVGEAADLVNKKCEEATGGVLFIDEAYAFIEEGTKEFGNNAITQLITWLEDQKWQKETIVILAGYPEEINNLFNKANKGLKGRFTQDNFVMFENYDSIEMLQIFEFNAHKSRITISQGVLTMLELIFRKLLQSSKNDKNWDNARRVENIFKLIFSNLRKRDSTNIDVQDIPETLRSIVEGKPVNDIRQTSEYIELSKLIGLENVKATITDLIESIEFEQYQIQNGIQVERSVQPLHLVFTGPPGTGKTTVARLFGGLLKSLGVITKGQIVEVTRKDLVGAHIGETEIKTYDAIERAMGGVLFIDEAYTLSNGSDIDYGKEAINTLLPIMENDRDKFVVIAAGYESQMDGFLESNPGLSDRFNQRISFLSYSDMELLSVFNMFITDGNKKISNDLHCILMQYFGLLKARMGVNFSNSRAVRKLYEETSKQQKKRLNSERKDRPLSDGDVEILLKSDLRGAIRTLNPLLENQINFDCAPSVEALPDVPFISLADDPISTTKDTGLGTEDSTNVEEKALSVDEQNLLFDYCIIDTNIWLEDKLNQPYYGSIRTIAMLYKKNSSCLAIHGSTYDEVIKFASDKRNDKINQTARFAKRVISGYITADVMYVPDMKAERDVDAYADRDLFVFAENQVLKDKSILVITNDRECGDRIRANLNNLRRANRIKVKYQVISGQEMLKLTETFKAGK